MRVGVANIMAYSWFSHSQKYLKALEYEKRFMKKQKVMLAGLGTYTLLLRSLHLSKLFCASIDEEILSAACNRFSADVIELLLT